MRRKVVRRIISLILVLIMLMSSVSMLAVSAAKTDGVGELYGTEFIQLPVGAVKPEGWLENQMLMMKENITGLMKEHSNYNVSTSEWLNGTSGEAWEKGPYFARGLVAMAYVLDDEELLDEAMVWVAAIIDSQDSTGFFGPKSNVDWWARMPALNVVRDFYEGASNKPESERTAKEKEYMAKVIPFFEKYFRYELANLPSRHLDAAWGTKRASDNVEIVYWLYEKQYDSSKPNDTKWMLDLVDVLFAQAIDWEAEANDTTLRRYNGHVVNTTQGIKYMPIKYQYTGEESLREAFSLMLDNIGLDHGRVDNMPNADESASDNRADRGTELCAVVEALISAGLAMETYGDAWIGDWMETLAYNSLPAAYSSDYATQSYFVQQNQPITTLGSHEFKDDDGNRAAYGAPGGFECCFPNNHSAWAKFVQNSWMATANGGLALITYGPNNVTASVKDGNTAVFREVTDYPFKNVVMLEYLGDDKASFELMLRIPEWAKSVTVDINGSSYSGMAAGEFYKIDRTWSCDDKVTIEFSAEVKLTRWFNNSSAVQHGALIYSLLIEEDWRKYEGEIYHRPTTDEQPLWEVYPTSPWNYGLVTDSNAEFEIEYGEVGLLPFFSENAPVKIEAKGVLLEEWTLNGNNAGMQPFGPIRYNKTDIEDITLIPYGCTNIRITQFPTMNNEEALDKVVRTKGETVKRAGVTYQEFDNIVVPSAASYDLKIEATGSGTVIINSKYTQAVNGSTTINNLQSLAGLTDGFKFQAGNFNNIKFKGNINVSKIEISINGKTIAAPTIISTKREANFIEVKTNLDALETPYELWYGTKSGSYTHKAAGFDGSTARIYNANPDEKYYIVAKATVNGIRMTSAEAVSENIFIYEDFAGNDSTGWTKYGNTSNITVSGEKLNFINDEANAKAVAGNTSWTNYTVEADITLTGTTNEDKDAGIMLRVTNASGEKPDTYNGYYFGYSSKSIVIGKPVNNAWNYILMKPLSELGISVNTNQAYRLKAVAYNNMLIFYFNGNPIYTVFDNSYSNGQVGVRSYMRSFSADNIVVRCINRREYNDIKSYLPKTGDVQALLSSDFANNDGAAWTKYGETNNITVSNNRINFTNNSTNVKAVAGNTSWTDYSIEAKITLTDTGIANKDAGLMFRVTDANSGSDAYKGYYFGYTPSSIVIGRSDNRWRAIKTIASNNGVNTAHTLKAVAYKNVLLFYFDGRLVYELLDESYSNGQIGLRSYMRNFCADDIKVNTISDSEFNDVQDAMARLYQIKISVTSADGTIHVTHPGVPGSINRIVWGTKSGEYTNSYEELPNRKGEGANLLGISVPNGTYFLRFYSVGANGEFLVESNEIMVTTGFKSDASTEKVALTSRLEAIKQLKTSNFTVESEKRLQDAIAYAEEVLLKPEASQMEYRVAKDILDVAASNSSTSYPTELDLNNDHKCDNCGKLTECVDRNFDHECDLGCDKEIGEHVDTDKDHSCDYGCDALIGACEDADNDGLCDYGCKKAFSINNGNEENGGETVGGGESNDKNPNTPDGSNNEASATDTPETEAPKTDASENVEKKGCGSTIVSLSSGFVALAMIVSTGILLKKKDEE